MSDSAVNVRLDHLESNQEDFKERATKMEASINEIKLAQTKNSVTLDRIESLLRWVSGGIFFSILAAIGKFIVSGKLSQ